MSRYTRLTRSVTELRAFSADRSPAANPSAVPMSAAGELVLTPGQKQALLKLRGSELCTAILDELRKRGEFVATTRDNYALEHVGLAINKGSFHVLSPVGRWRAEAVARTLATAAGLHIITYDYDRPGAARASCNCGWSTFRTRAIKSFVMSLGRDATEHLLRESVKQIEGAKS
jgi:hypothetical protein